jgi:hypothetical protein
MVTPWNRGMGERMSLNWKYDKNRRRPAYFSDRNQFAVAPRPRSFHRWLAWCLNYWGTTNHCIGTYWSPEKAMAAAEQFAADHPYTQMIARHRRELAELDAGTGYIPNFTLVSVPERRSLVAPRW